MPERDCQLSPGLRELKLRIGDLLAELQEHDEVVLTWPVQVTRNRLEPHGGWRLGKLWRAGAPRLTAPGWAILLYAFLWKPLLRRRVCIPRCEHAIMSPRTFAIFEVLARNAR